jgi:ankyrin repeat protein
LRSNLIYAAQAGASRNLRVQDGRTGLMMAASKGHAKVCQLLLAGRIGRATIDLQSLGGDTALLIA